MPYYTYILASRTKTLYIGVTNDIERRVWEHKAEELPGFAQRYNVDKLVYYEDYEWIQDAVVREKQLKGRLRRKKIELIESVNPGWDDLAATWFNGPGDSSLRSE